MDKQWGTFSKKLSKKIVADKRKFLNKFAKLNHIRNAVMHPIKDQSLTEVDFEFVYGFWREIISQDEKKN